MPILLFFFITLGCLDGVHAEPYTPQTDNEVIAHWPIVNTDASQKNKTVTTLKDAVTIANLYLAHAAEPGQSKAYGDAENTLKPFITKEAIDKNLWLTWAQLQQHQHRFDIAQDALQKVLALEPNNISANLLVARIALIQENPIKARNACLKLLGNADLITVTACSLEANSYLSENELRSSYEQLSALVAREGLPSDERATWITQLLADMALRTNNIRAAAEVLTTPTEHSSVNYFAQWADVHLLLNNNEDVFNRLSNVVSNALDIDDALLLRIVIAEKKLARTNLQTSHWKKQLDERIALREQRGDVLHASDLARYYLDVNPNPERAVHWARINIQVTREESDRQLIARAENSLKNPLFTEKKDD